MFPLGHQGRGIRFPLDIKIWSLRGAVAPRPFRPGASPAYIASLAPPSLREGGCNTVIETIHPIISSTFTTRLDLHTLQRAFTTHHLTRLDRPSTGLCPFNRLSQ